MSNKDIYNMLNELDKNDIKDLINISIEYLVYVYSVDFKSFIKDEKKLHKKLMKRGNK